MADRTLPAGQSTLRGSLLAAAKCGSVRFGALYLLFFYLGLLDGGGAGLGLFALGTLVWPLQSFTTEIVNRLSDRTEDRINRPRRTRMCEAVGYPVLRRLAVGLCCALVALYLLWYLLWPAPVLLILLPLGLLVAVNYSYGLRLKAQRWVCYVVLTFPFGGPWVIGWWATKDTIGSELAVSFFQDSFPFLAVGGLFMISLVGAKDLTDTRGDRLVGYWSVFVDLARRWNTTKRVGVVMVPFLLCAVLITLGLLPTRFAGLFLLAPFSVLFAMAVRGASGERERDAVRELMYHYMFVFLAFGGLLQVPEVSAVIATIVLTGLWVGASQWLHWSGGITLQKVRAALVAVRATTGRSARDRRRLSRGRERDVGQRAQGADSGVDGRSP